MLSPDNVWYGRLKLLFTLSVKIDGNEDPMDIKCAFISFFYDMRLEPSGSRLVRTEMYQFALIGII